MMDIIQPSSAVPMVSLLIMYFYIVPVKTASSTSIKTAVGKIFFDLSNHNFPPEIFEPVMSAAVHRCETVAQSQQEKNILRL